MPLVGFIGDPIAILSAIRYNVRNMNLADLLSDLKGIGISQKEIGDAIGRSQSTVSELASAKRPAYQTVERLKKFHAQQMRRARAA
jgi:predicted transcriptional regulator